MSPHHTIPQERTTLTKTSRPTGKATKVEPGGVWAESGLSQLFTIRQTTVTSSLPPGNSTAATHSPTATPSTSPDTDSTSGVAIVGTAVAAVADVSIMAGAIFFWLRRHRQGKQHSAAAIPEKDSLPAYSTAASRTRLNLLGRIRLLGFLQSRAPRLLSGQIHKSR